MARDRRPRHARHWLGRLFGAAIVAFSAGTLVWEGLRLTPVARFWLFELLDIFGALLYAPWPVLVTLAVIRRSGPALVWLALPALLFLGEYGSQLLPVTPRASGSTIRVMSANIVFANRNAASFVEVVEQERPDVLAIQELGTHMAGPLGDQLRATYPHQALYPSESTDGLGIFSRLPFEHEEPADIGWAPGPCFCQSVVVQVAGRPVTLLNVHPGPPDVGHRPIWRIPVPRSFDSQEDEPARQQILARVRSAEGPLVLLGDLNTGDRQPYYRKLREHVGDAFREAGRGFGFTFPGDRSTLPPVVRIDYVMHKGPWRAIAAYTGHWPESDHLYVVADLALLDAPVQ